MEKICLNCENTFLKKKSLSHEQWIIRKYCCYMCSVEFKNKIQKQKKIASKKCEYCGKYFFKKSNQSKDYWNKRKGCSRSCSHKIKFKYFPPYKRDESHKEKMSIIIKNLPSIEKHRERFSKMNSDKKGKTIEEIYGIDKAIKIRKKLTKFGKENGNWIDGRSFLPYKYSFNKNLKKKIKIRDNYICKNCGISESEYKNKETLKRGLTIHHIDYDKNNSDENNLITLCKKCNSLANGNREIWKIKYQKLLGQ